MHRTTLTLIAIATLIGCEGAAIPRCVPGAVMTCPCSGGGQATQVCAADGTFGICGCVIDSGVDAGSGDARSDAIAADSSDALTAVVDATLDTRDASADAAFDVPPRCTPRTSGADWVSRGPLGVLSGETPASLPTIAIGPDDQPVVAWQEQASASARDIYAKQWTGST